MNQVLNPLYIYVILSDEETSSVTRSPAQARAAPIEQIVRGSLTETYKSCARPNCHCADGPGHGPKRYLSTIARTGERPQLGYVRNAAYAQVAKLLANLRKATGDAQRDLCDQCRTSAPLRESRLNGPGRRCARLRQGGRRPRQHDRILSSWWAPCRHPTRRDDVDDCRSTSVAPSIHLNSSVDDRAGSLQSGEHRVQVRSGEQDIVSRLEFGTNPDPRPRLAHSNQDSHRLGKIFLNWCYAPSGRTE